MLLEDSSSPNREGSSSVWCSWGALKIQVLVPCVYMSHLSSEFSTITTNTVVITLGKKKKILLLTGAPPGSTTYVCIPMHLPPLAATEDYNFFSISYYRYVKVYMEAQV